MPLWEEMDVAKVLFRKSLQDILHIIYLLKPSAELSGSNSRIFNAACPTSTSPLLLIATQEGVNAEFESMLFTTVASPLAMASVYPSIWGANYRYQV